MQVSSTNGGHMVLRNDADIESSLRTKFSTKEKVKIKKTLGFFKSFTYDFFLSNINFNFYDYSCILDVNV